MKTELVLPVGNWQNKSESERVEDFSSALLELQRKPNIFWLTVDQFKKLKTGTRIDTPYFKAEHIALESEIDWVTNRNERCAIWISPQLEGIYNTARLILSRKYESEEQTRILNVAICLTISNDNNLRIANLFSRFSETPTTIVNAEKLRETPIFFDLPEGKQFSSIVEILSGEKIENILKRKLEAKHDATNILEPHHKDISSTSSTFGQIFIGATLEQQALAQGYLLNQFRDCPGILNSEALKQMGVFDKVFTLTNNPDRYTYDEIAECKSCKSIKKVASSKSGGCGVCRDCQIKFDSGELQ